MSIFSNRRINVLLVIIAVAFIWNHNRKTADETSPETLDPGKTAVQAPPPAPAEIPDLPAAPAAADPAAPDSDAPVATPPTPVPAPPAAGGVFPGSVNETPAPAEDIAEEISALDATLRNFRAALGENPVGSNAEITSALLGNNPKQIKFELPTGSSLNADQEMCDRWGTPYFFHQISGTHMEIRSAGPDRKMWTGDDSQM
jgi:hypothetical protein